MESTAKGFKDHLMQMLRQSVDNKFVRLEEAAQLCGEHNKTVCVCGGVATRWCTGVGGGGAQQDGVCVWGGQQQDGMCGWVGGEGGGTSAHDCE